MSHFIDGKEIAFDTETTGIRLWQGDEPFAFSFANEAGETAYFEFRVNPFTRKVIPDHAALRKIAGLLEDPKVTKIGHNLKFDARGMELAWGIKIAGPGGPIREGGKFFETMFLAHIANSLEPSLKLKQLASKYAEISNSDETALKKMVVRCRNKAKKLGWKLAFDVTKQPDGSFKTKALTAADYWIPAELFLRHRSVEVEEARLCEKYARLDALRTMQLKQLYWEVLHEEDCNGEEGCNLGIWNFEQSLWNIIYRMEERGVAIYPDRLEKEIQHAIGVRECSFKEVEAKSWPNININSHPQLRRFIYETLKLPVNEKLNTKTGLASTAMAALKQFQHVSAIRSILNFKGATKAYGFFRKYEKLSVADPFSPENRALHTDFRQLKAKTGRLSAIDPNLMQVTTEEGTRSIEAVDARGPYGPRKGFWWLHEDYKGMEVRVFADVSREPTMFKACQEGREIHDEITNHGWGGPNNEAGIRETVHALALDGSDIGKNVELLSLCRKWKINDWRKLTESNKVMLADQFLKSFNYDIVKAHASIGKKGTKNRAKMVTFLKIYGGKAKSASRVLEVSLEEAKDFMAHYDRQFPRINEFANEYKHECLSRGFAVTRWGRRLRITREKAYRCVNYLVQGTSADLLKASMIKCDRFFKQGGFDAHLLMPIHDELVFEIRPEDMTCRLIKQIGAFMSDTEGRLAVTMPVEPAIAKVMWREKVKVKLCRS